MFQARIVWVVLMLAVGSGCRHDDKRSARPVRKVAATVFAPGLLRGHAEVTWTAKEGGVAYSHHTHEDLSMQLEVSENGRAVLSVEGPGDSTGVFWMEEDTKAPDEHRYNRSGKWTGQVDRHGVLRLHSSRSPDNAQAFECGRQNRRVEGVDVPLVCCMPLHQYDGFSWEDPLPAYMRLPLIFAARGIVHTKVEGEHGDMSPSRVVGVDIWRWEPTSRDNARSFPYPDSRGSAPLTVCGDVTWHL